MNVSSLRISSLNVIPQDTSTRSPVIAIVGSFAAGALLAVALLLGPASGGTEPLVTGSVLFAFGLGWALMAVLTTRFSAQPQAWMAAPAAFLGSIGLGLIVFQPGPAVMDLLSWVWPPALAILAIWMFAQVRRQLRGRGRWFVVPVIATLLVFAIGGAIATISGANGLAASSQTGRLIDVGGHRLYIDCTGTGSPVVVLQSGLGESSSYWGRIAPVLAPSTTVCAYDRAGHGRSDTVAAPQDGIAIATDLHTLLERADVPGPYVLVGHSSGGPYVRVFAARYPDQIAGMVLLDAQPADAFTALPDYPHDVSDPADRLFAVAAAGSYRPSRTHPRTAGRPVHSSGRSGRTRRGRRASRGPAGGARVQESWRPTAHRRHGRIGTAGRLARSTGPVARPLHEQQPPRPSDRHPHLDHQRCRRRGVQPGDPRRRVVVPDRDDRPMNAASDRILTQNGRWIPAVAVDGRIARVVIATLVVGGYIALGFAFRLSAEAYLLLGSRSPSHSRCWSSADRSGRSGSWARRP